MTPDERAAIKAYIPGAVSYPVASFDKRFIRVIAEVVEGNPEWQPTDNQWKQIRRIAHRYRRQVPARHHLALCSVCGPEMAAPLIHELPPLLALIAGVVLLVAACQAPGLAAAPPTATDTSDAARRPTSTPAATPFNANVTWAYHAEDDQHPDVLMQQSINAAHSELNAAIYAINRPIIVQALSDAQARCACVRLISDREQTASDPRQTAALMQLKTAGVPIKTDTHRGLMHMKVVEIDRADVLAGSFNATNAASTTNDEILLHISSPEVAMGFGAQFERMWADTRRFADWPRPGTPVPVPSPALEF